MKVLIVDDHQMFANGLASLLREINPDLEITKVNSGAAALAHLAENQVQLLTTDISMPDMNGIELIAAIRERGYTCQIMAISMHTEVAIVKAMLKENPNAYLLKNTNTEELKAALQALENKETFYCEAVKNILLNDVRGIERNDNNIIPKLSPRELEVLELMVAEKTTAEIAKSLFLSDHTVETYRKNLLRKLDAKNSVGLVAKAFQLGILS